MHRFLNIRLLAPLERVLDALTNRARGESNVIIALIAYALVWTLYGVLAKGSQDLHYDMAEQVALAREPAFGYARHPPLAALVVKAWFSVFPLTDGSYYLLAMTVVSLTLWITWRLLGDYLQGEKRVVGLMLLMFIPFFNFHALKFNVNTVLMPVWAATTLWFLRSYETRSVFYAALAGLGAAGAMYGKYWSIFLLAGLGIAALLDSRRGSYFRSAAPWVTIAVGLLVLVPHLVWLYQNDFSPFSFAVSQHGKKPLAAALTSTLGYLAGAAAYAALPAALAFMAARPSRSALADTLSPSAPHRRLAALAFWMPLLLPALVAPFAGVELVSLWTMSAWTLLPVVLLSSPLLTITRADAIRVLAVAVAFPVVMTLAAPGIALAIHYAGVKPAAAHSRLLVNAVEHVWHQTTEQPLRLVGGDPDLAFGVAFYSAEQPSAFPDLDSHLAPWVTPQRLDREGIALVCNTTDQRCVARATALAGGRGGRLEITLQRSYWGQLGDSARYLILTVPPQR
jgi:hypothetical protein